MAAARFIVMVSLAFGGLYGLAMGLGEEADWLMAVLGLPLLYLSWVLRPSMKTAIGGLFFAVTGAYLLGFVIVGYISWTALKIYMILTFGLAAGVMLCGLLPSAGKRYHETEDKAMDNLLDELSVEERAKVSRLHEDRRKVREAQTDSLLFKRRRQRRNKR